MTDYDNEEAMTPDDTGPTTVQFVGDVLRAFTEHGLAWERKANNATALSQGLLRRQRMAHKAMDEADRRIGELQETVKERDTLLYEMWALICNSAPNADLPLSDHGAWSQRMRELRDAYHATLGLAQTDAQPTEAPAEGEVSTCECPRSEFGTTVCSTSTNHHPAVPSAG